MNDFMMVFLFSDNARSVFHEIEVPLILGVVILVIGLVLLVLGLISSYKYKKPYKTNRALIAGGFATVFAVGWLGTFSFIYKMDHQTYSKLLNVYNAQQYKIAEGSVRVISKQPPKGADPDVIVVNHVIFEIYNRSTFGYTVPISKGGVLREGVFAKIYYYKNTILRIDIKQ